MGIPSLAVDLGSHCQLLPVVSQAVIGKGGKICSGGFSMNLQVYLIDQSGKVRR